MAVLAKASGCRLGAGPLSLRLDARRHEQDSEVATPDAVFLAGGRATDASKGSKQPQVYTIIFCG